ncbi:hypothetical protein [Desulfurella sp.]|uniref:hypothetical protein n=1 Tax=Desulfurella sp. TaxID=1962857 RepID=UPI0025C287A6|nr:hypothetical protein [Desulfurella sp.]
MDNQLELCIENIMRAFECLIEISRKERICLIAIDTDGILSVLQEKETHLNNINTNLNKLQKLGVSKAFLSKYESKIIEISSKFLYENSINEKIAKQHLAFSTSMLNLYTNFMQLNQTYNNKAYIPYKSNFTRTV